MFSFSRSSPGYGDFSSLCQFLGFFEEKNPPLNCTGYISWRRNKPLLCISTLQFEVYLLLKHHLAMQRQEVMYKKECIKNLFEWILGNSVRERGTWEIVWPEERRAIPQHPPPPSQLQVYLGIQCWLQLDCKGGMKPERALGATARGQNYNIMRLGSTLKISLYLRIF